MKFLLAMPATWNISMFHYRNQGADYSRVLVGLQIPKADPKQGSKFFTEIGYVARNMTNDPAYRLFLGA